MKGPFRHCAVRMALVLAGLLAGWPVLAAEVTGTWYGSGMQPGQSDYRLHWLAENQADGGFSIQFYEERDCQLVPANQERGRWSLGNGLYTILTTEVDGKPTPPGDRFFHDVYEVLELSDEHFRFTSIATGIEFSNTRVAVGHRPTLTGCDGNRPEPPAPPLAP